MIHFPCGNPPAELKQLTEKVVHEKKANLQIFLK